MGQGQRRFSISMVCCSVSTISSIPHTQVGQLTSACHLAPGSLVPLGPSCRHLYSFANPTPTPIHVAKNKTLETKQKQLVRWLR